MPIMAMKGRVRDCIHAGMVWRMRSVLTQPGWSTIQIKPSGPNSAANDLVNMFSAALLAR